MQSRAREVTQHAALGPASSAFMAIDPPVDPEVIIL